MLRPSKPWLRQEVLETAKQLELQNRRDGKSGHVGAKTIGIKREKTL
jgi:hypothetical protein